MTAIYRNSNKNKHLTLEERIIIERSIEKGSTKTAIAKVLGKDNSTIGKEIAQHRTLTYRCALPLECAVYKKCKHGRLCHKDCPDYRPFYCPRRDRSPGACNGCPTYRNCRFSKYRYEAYKAQANYKEVLVDARKGLDLDKDDVERLASIVVPAIKKGLSPYHIVHMYPDIGISEKTLYNYIAQGVFRPWNVIDLDLRQKVKRKQPKKETVTYKKREDKKHLKGRLYTDYLQYISEEPDLSTVQMDTIYNRIEGPFIQTFHFLEYDFSFGFFHEKRTAENMVKGINLLEDIIGKDLFIQHIRILLTDRGGEFSNPEAMEKDSDGLTRTRIFYCDPQAAWQKGALEKRHTEWRYILPKEIGLRELGLLGQDDLNLVLSHLNSVPREKTRGKSPFELLQFFCPELLGAFTDFGIHEIPKDEVILMPYLLKK
jgi:IS30 family transposase